VDAKRRAEIEMMAIHDARKDFEWNKPTESLIEEIAGELAFRSFQERKPFDSVEQAVYDTVYNLKSEELRNLD